MKDDRRSWLPSGAGLAGFLAATLVGLFIGLPMMVMVLQSGGGCEGVPAPCQPDNTALNIALLVLAALLFGTWWGVRRLINFFYHGE